MQNRILIITGPTAVGKTDIALNCADALHAEIINADVGQCYQPLTIGTAKPDWQSSPIKHHGFDIITQPKDYTVVAYRAYVQNLVKDIWSRNKLPLFVGGSLFYIQTLFFPLCDNQQLLPHEAPDDVTWQALHAIDPIRAQAIHPHDTYRITRAIALWHATKKKPSTSGASYQPFCNAHIIFFTRDRSALYQNINDRVLQMFDQGFIEEVMRLQGTEWEPFLKQKKLIGYNDIFNYLLGCHKDPLSREKLIATIQQKTRRYAKRQYTFWRMLSKRLDLEHSADYTVTTQTVDLTICDYDLYINRLVAQMQSHL